MGGRTIKCILVADTARPVSGDGVPISACIDQKAVPYAYLICFLIVFIYFEAFICLAQFFITSCIFEFDGMSIMLVIMVKILIVFSSDTTYLL